MVKLNREQKREIVRIVRKTLLSWSEGKKPKHQAVGICGNIDLIKIPNGRIIDSYGIARVLEKAKPDLFGDSSTYPIKHPSKGNCTAYADNMNDQWGLRGKSKEDKEYVGRRKLACKILARSKKTVEVDEDGDVVIIFGNTDA